MRVYWLGALYTISYTLWLTVQLMNKIVNFAIILNYDIKVIILEIHRYTFNHYYTRSKYSIWFDNFKEHMGMQISTYIILSSEH